MIYLVDEKKKLRKERFMNLIQIWNKSKTLAEFLVSADIDCPDATWFEITCFKLRYFWKSSWSIIPQICLVLSLILFLIGMNVHGLMGILLMLPFVAMGSLFFVYLFFFSHTVIKISQYEH